MWLFNLSLQLKIFYFTHSLQHCVSLEQYKTECVKINGTIETVQKALIFRTCSVPKSKKAKSNCFVAFVRILMSKQQHEEKVSIQCESINGYGQLVSLKHVQ